RSRPGTCGHVSPQPMVTSRFPCAATSVVSSCGRAAERSMPLSCIATMTSGWTPSAGFVPAEKARAFAGSANYLKNAAAICERPALWPKAKMPTPMQSGPCDAWRTPWDCTSPGVGERWNEPVKQSRGRDRTEELRGNEARNVSELDAGERIGERAGEGH